MSARYKNIFFDMDGTLIDSGAALCRSFAKVMSEETGRQVRPEEYAPYWGLPGEHAFKGYGIADEERINRGKKRWIRYYRESQDWSPLFPGIEELLEELMRSGFVLGIVTSKTREELEAQLVRSPLAKWLPHRVNADDTRLHKPHPDPLLEIVKRLQVDKKDCLYVGDTLFDSQCAAGAGIDFALACWGLLFGEPEGIRAVAKPRRPADVLEVADGEVNAD